MKTYIDTEIVREIGDTISTQISTIDNSSMKWLSTSGFSREVIQLHDFESNFKTLENRLTNLKSRLEKLKSAIDQACEIYEKADKASLKHEESEKFILSTAIYSSKLANGENKSFSEAEATLLEQVGNDTGKISNAVDIIHKSGKFWVPDEDLSSLEKTQSILSALSVDVTILQKIFKGDMKYEDFENLYNSNSKIIESILKKLKERGIGEDVIGKVYKYFSVLGACFNLKDFIDKLSNLVDNGFSDDELNDFANDTIYTVVDIMIASEKIPTPYVIYVKILKSAYAFFDYTIRNLTNAEKPLTVGKISSVIMEASLVALQKLTGLSFDPHEVAEELRGWANDCAITLSDRGVSISNLISVMTEKGAEALGDHIVNLGNLIKDNSNVPKTYHPRRIDGYENLMDEKIQDDQIIIDAYKRKLSNKEV